MATAKRNIIKVLPEEKIIYKIYIIREQKVMLDFDLAGLYEVETKALNQAVKRNADRFPEDFMFRLTVKEWLLMRSQFVTSSSQSKRKNRYAPYAFTEHGVTMVSKLRINFTMML